MKIAMIGHKVVPSREGGVEVVVEELSKRLIKMGHQVDIYNRKRKYEHNKVYNGAKIITIPTINKKGVDAFIYSFLASIIASLKKYDVLHYHAEGSCAMLWIPHILKKRIIVTIHGLDWKRSKWRKFCNEIHKIWRKVSSKVCR